MKRSIALILAAAAAVVMMGCNTMAGMGKDIERGGDKLEDAAKDTQRRM